MLSTLCGYDGNGTLDVGTVNEVGTVDDVGTGGAVLGCDASVRANASAVRMQCGLWV